MKTFVRWLTGNQPSETEWIQFYASGWIMLSIGAVFAIGIAVNAMLQGETFSWESLVLVGIPLLILITGGLLGIYGAKVIQNDGRIHVDQNDTTRYKIFFFGFACAFGTLVSGAPGVIFLTLAIICFVFLFMTKKS